MYFPFLRGKRHEFFCLQALKGIIRRNENIIPIIEPIEVNELTVNYFEKLQKSNIPYIIITNPSVGGCVKDPSRIYDSIVSKLDLSRKVYLAFIIDGKTTKKQLTNFINAYYSCKKCFIHLDMYNNIDEYFSLIDSCDNTYFHILNNINTSSNYKKRITKKYGKTVILEDGFKKQPKNADYPDESYFSDLMFTYKDDGYIGYSDYLTIGSKFDSKGMTPYAVAIHYSHSEFKDDTEYICIKHFVSDRKETQKDPAGKFLEALNKLINFINSTPYINTIGTEDFKELYRTKHYPGLGKIKEISMKHHIELLSIITKG